MVESMHISWRAILRTSSGDFLCECTVPSAYSLEAAADKAIEQFRHMQPDEWERHDEFRVELRRAYRKDRMME
jgi:hypothetical protein